MTYFTPSEEIKEHRVQIPNQFSSLIASSLDSDVTWKKLRWRHVTEQDSFQRNCQMRSMDPHEGTPSMHDGGIVVLLNAYNAV